MFTQCVSGAECVTSETIIKAKENLLSSGLVFVHEKSGPRAGHWKLPAHMRKQWTLTVVRHQHRLNRTSVHCGPVSYLVAEICDEHGLQKTD